MGAGLNKDSVFNKITSQIGALNELGVTTKGIFFSVIDRNHPEQLVNNNLSYVKVRPVVRGWFRNLRERIRFTRALYRWSHKNASNYDVLYVRAYRPTLYWLLFLLRCRGKVITEHQTKEPDELKTLWSENRFGFKPSDFLGWLEHNIIPWYQENILGTIALMLTKNIVCVTHEIAKYEISRAFFFKPKANVIGNGIKANDINLVTHKKFDGKELALIMAVGGTTETAWHGLDLLLNSINRYKGPVKINLYLAGNTTNLSQYKNNHVFFLGHLDKNELNEKMKECHLGVGSIALQRKGLSEASTLKIREYAASGLPFFFGHDDIDLDKLVSQGLALKIKPMEVPDMQEIIDFAARISNIPEFSISLREYAKAHLDTSKKMKTLVEVIHQSTA
jgi:hypothetical protein